MEAVAVGHDLARGKAKFFRSRPTVTDAATGPEADSVVRGEAAELVPGEEVPVGYGEGMPEVDEPTFDPVAALLARGNAATSAEPATPGDGDPGAPGEPGTPGEGEPGAPGDLEIEVEALVEEQDRREQDGGEADGRRRSRRTPKREPVPA
jgi:single-strand DNA-binding protein